MTIDSDEFTALLKRLPKRKGEQTSLVFAPEGSYLVYGDESNVIFGFVEIGEVVEWLRCLPEKP